jgi:hypothetical protein
MTPITQVSPSLYLQVQLLIPLIATLVVIIFIQARIRLSLDVDAGTEVRLLR